MYYGEKKFTSVVDLGDGNVKVIFKDKSAPLTLNKEIFESAKSDKAIDLTELQRKRIIPVIQILLMALFKYDVKVSEVGAILDEVSNSLNFNLEEAENKLWGVTKQAKLMSDVDKVLRENDKDTEDNKSN